MRNEIELMDIADDLLILNKTTIDTLMELDNCADCIALYVFYYKTAKWQKTNQVKASDEYVKKCLKWGRDKIAKTKTTLKENGLIEIVQTRKDNKISGWYIKVGYLVNKKKIEDCKVRVNNTQNQQVGNPTSTDEDINALKQYIKCLETENKMLKEEKAPKKKSATVASLLGETNISLPVREKLLDFLAYRKEIKKPLKSERSIRSLLKQVETQEQAHGAFAVIDVIDRSIQNGWQGLFFDKIQQGKQQQNRRAEELDSFYRMADDWAHEQNP